MALQVVSILSSSKGALEVDDKDPPTSQKSADHKEAEASSSGSKFGSPKLQLSRFGKTSASNKPGSAAAEGTGGGATGEVTPLNKYFKTFMVELLRMFDADRSLLDSKGSFVIR